jgi:glutamine synthetase
MQPSPALPGATSAESVASLIRERGLSHVKIGVTDIDGVLRGKLIAASTFLDGLANGLTFCDCIVGWDSDDTLYTNNPDGITGWHTGYPDTPIRPVPATARTLPDSFDGRGLLVLCEFDGKAEAICPRTLLRTTVEKAASMGYAVHAGFEYEFGLFRETRESVRAKHFRGLTPVTPGNFGYSLLRADNLAGFCEATLLSCTALDVPLLALHTENGPGIWEAAIDATTALEAADRAALFKANMKALAQRHGLIATFMAKWAVEHQGQGGHMHLSLRDSKSGAPVFGPDGGRRDISETMRHFIGGQQRLLPEFLAMVAGTVNAFSRLTPGAWAPTSATWGFDNRTCALRVVGRSAASRRVEYRVAAADANPYLALAAALAAGLHGIEHRIEPTDPVAGNAYTQSFPPPLRLPATLWESAQRFRNSAAARDAFGQPFVDHLAAAREWEESRFRAAVTDWELARYFEVI